MEFINRRLLSLRTISRIGDKQCDSAVRPTGCFAVAGKEVMSNTGDRCSAEGWATTALVATTLQINFLSALWMESLKSFARTTHRNFRPISIVAFAYVDSCNSGSLGMDRAIDWAKSVQGATTRACVFLHIDCKGVAR